jgi:hypothetical protein
MSHGRTVQLDKVRSRQMPEAAVTKTTVAQRLVGRAFSVLNKFSTFFKFKPGRINKASGTLGPFTKRRKFSALNFTLLKRMGGMIVSPGETIINILPSAGALNTLLAAIEPLAPVTFFTITVCAKALVSPGAMARATKSVMPPAGKGETRATILLPL